ncbi:MAG: T9SS type A sorting domain-containing protein, partial [Fidelibacterota bacterium]
IDAKIGFNFMPVIDDTWGESMAASYYADNDIAYGHRGDSTQIGFKFLSHELAACRIIDYADYSYETDTTLYTYVTYDGIDTDFVSPGADGPVVFPSIAAVTLATGDSVEVFVGIAFGRDSTSMVDNMEAAETAYGGLLGIDADTSPIPQAFVLKQNYPNPFNPGTAIEFDLNASGRVSLQVFNLRGQLVSTLVDNWLSAGNYTVMFDGADLPSGIYFYTLAAGRTFTTHKMVLLK